ncbi:MAG: carboxypeptidase-like regulatory domain-containing protein [Balneolaceae bacterium]
MLYNLRAEKYDPFLSLISHSEMDITKRKKINAMELKNIFINKAAIFFTITSLIIISGCVSPGAQLLNRVPINSLDVEVLDKEGNPIQGAQVEASNGRKTTTDANGIANVRFGSVGIHSVTVMADNYMPNNTIVTMPADRGKTITAHLTTEVQLAGINFGTINMYPMMFNYLFTGYGYQLELEDYSEGGWTEWRTDESDETFLRKAFLKKLDNGQEWWQIVITDNEGDEEDKYIAEVLFSEDRASIVRLREKIGDAEAQEKPVSEGWYNEPQKLTKESIEGALVEENVSVSVPSKNFTADLLDFGVAPGISMKMWRVSSSEVPGGIVKYETSNEDENLSSMELTDYGHDATTVLESY